MRSSFTEDHLVEQQAIHLMQHELGWDVVNCYGEWSGGVSDLGRDGKREEGNIEHRTPNIERRREEMKMNRTKPALLRLYPDLPMEAIDGAVGEEILNVEFWILNGGGRCESHAAAYFLISLEWVISCSAEIVGFTEIELLRDFTDSANFTAC